MGYHIPFKSFKNTDYVLEINGGGTVLDGAVDTFVTEEDSDTDFFKPVRTQSGTFRYLGSGNGDRAVWLAMIPTNALSIPVKLKIGSDVKWQGYIQPNVYHNDYPANGGLMEHEFAVQCPLSVLDTVDCDTAITNDNAVISFGKLLKDYIFSAITSRGTTINYIYLQGNAAGTRARLNTKVMWANFIETDSDGTTKSKYTYGVLLEEICKMFGYSCRNTAAYEVEAEQLFGEMLYKESFSWTGDGKGWSNADFTLNDELASDVVTGGDVGYYVQVIYYDPAVYKEAVPMSIAVMSEDKVTKYVYDAVIGG